MIENKVEFIYLCDPCRERLDWQAEKGVGTIRHCWRCGKNQGFRTRNYRSSLTPLELRVEDRIYEDDKRPSLLRFQGRIGRARGPKHTIYRMLVYERCIRRWYLRTQWEQLLEPKL